MYLSAKRDVAIVVDAYTSGALIAPAFRAKGVQCVHVRSEAEVTDDYASSFKPADFADDILFTSVDDLRARLAGRRVRWALPGSELGVDLAAHLADAFRTELRNDSAHVRRWRDKHDMHDALEAAGVRCIPHVKSGDLTVIKDWVATTTGFPVVLKPPSSAGTDNVHICSDMAAVERAFHAIFGARDTFLRENREVVAQMFLDNGELGAPHRSDDGERRSDVEYCINTVSLDGRHYVSDVIKVYRRRIGQIPVHDYNELLCPVADAEAYAVLSRYIERVLDALGIVNGPGHSEVMVVDGAPVLLETAARLPGSTDMSAYSKALGFCQAELWMMACTHPEAFLAHAGRPRAPLRYHSSCVFLISEVEGRIVRPPDLRPWLDLPSLHSLSVMEQGQLSRTIDLTNIPGYVFLLAKDRSALPDQRERLRQAEQAIYRDMIDALTVGGGAPA